MECVVLYAGLFIALLLFGMAFELVILGLVFGLTILELILHLSVEGMFWMLRRLSEPKRTDPPAEG